MIALLVLVGDQIIRINGYPIDHFIHEEVLALLKAKPNIVLKVKSVGMIPIKDNKRDPITWKMVEPDPCSSGSDGTHSVSSGSSIDEFVETKVFISGIGGSSLGCSVVKGPPELPGIFVQTVKPHGLAEIAGLEIGDQITEVNGQGFVNVEFSEERLRRINARLCNRNGKARNGNHATNGNHTIRNRTLYTNGTNGKGSPESFHDTLTNGSLSEMSDRSTSLSSSQSTSPVTNGHTNGTNGLVEYGQKLRSSENGPHHHHLYGTNGQHLLLVPKLSLVGAEERQRIEEEKRRLLEKEQLLQLEAEKLAEERRQLEAQKQLQQQQQLQHEHQQQQQQHPRPATMPAAPPAPPQMHVFAELHSVAQQRRLLREKAAQNGDAAAPRKPGGIRPGLRPDAKPSPDVLIKQKQHEQLMVEFREVHKKMFGATNAVVAPSERSGSQQSHVDGDLRKSAALINAQEAQRAKETMEQALGEHASTVKDDKAAPAAAVANGVEAKDEAQGQDKSKATAVPSTELSSVEGIPAEYHSTVSAGPTGPGYVTDYATLSLPSEVSSSVEQSSELGGGGGNRKRHWPTYVPPTHPNPHMFIQPANADKGLNGLRSRRSVRVEAIDGAKVVSLASSVAFPNTSVSSDARSDGKDGPLNLILDGGLNSAHDGRIVVAEVREGGMVPVDGEISAGDQILMVDNTRLVNSTLTAARVAIQNAMASAHVCLCYATATSFVTRKCGGSGQLV
ncbi:hypothetical protein HPB51_017816 [Rhipicephalus microplus]|uniref:PDZ domain-containing protein n=1 Tax=Rhipicephalus microplus TaxID=6941 RepID=A0A9J6DW68_RHIMP|nr:hypothetical protein HPB51_017816 [Rhipicephalus microplus]